MKLQTIMKVINKIIINEKDKPQVNIINKKEIILIEGSWLARQKIEDYFIKKGLVSFVSNQPNKKRIGLNCF